MTICEFCARPHHATDPDDRFCSFLCRDQFEKYAAVYTPSELVAEQIKQGENLRMYLRLLMRTGALLLQQTETLDFEQQTIQHRAWIRDITAKENLMLGLSDLLEPPTQSS